MLFKLRKHRAFHYQPLYYKPETDERQRRKIRFQQARRKARSQRSFVFLLAALGIVIYFLYLLSQRGY